MGMVTDMLADVAANDNEGCIRLYEFVMESPAYCSLDICARALYLHFLALYDGRNNGRIRFSRFQTGWASDVSEEDNAQAIFELEDRGFIVATQTGSNIDAPTHWAITEFPIDYPVPEAEPRNTFLDWSPNGAA